MVLKYCMIACCSGIVSIVYQNVVYYVVYWKHKILIMDFGEIGDARTLNMKSFCEPIYIKYLRRRRGILLTYL